MIEKGIHSFNSAIRWEFTDRSVTQTVQNTKFRIPFRSHRVDFVLVRFTPGKMSNWCDVLCLEFITNIHAHNTLWLYTLFFLSLYPMEPKKDAWKLLCFRMKYSYFSEQNGNAKIRILFRFLECGREMLLISAE